MGWIEDAVNWVFEQIKTGAANIIKSLYTIDGLKLFDVTFSTDDIPGTVAQLTDFSNTQNLSIYTIGSVINTVVTPIALSLLVLFFMISLIKKFTEIEKVSWERLLLWGCYLFFIMALVQNSYTLLTKIMNIVNGIYTDISGHLSQVSGTTSIGTAIYNTIMGYDDIGSVLIGIILYLVAAIPYLGSVIQIWTQILLRVIKLMLCMAFSPIPIAMAVEGENYRGKAISYLMYSAGVGFEGVVILIGSWVYSLGLSQLSQNANTGQLNVIIGLLIMNALFIAVIQLAHEFSERMFGRS